MLLMIITITTTATTTIIIIYFIFDTDEGIQRGYRKDKKHTQLQHYTEIINSLHWLSHMPANLIKPNTQL
jgi:hypothetical protein